MRAVAAAARRTVVVVNAATPVLMPWLDGWTRCCGPGCPARRAGHAIAAALLGDIEPAGRLVTTFPAADGAAPAWSVTPVDGELEYDEGTFIGYRGHYAGRAPAPAFWLGHGLGYTTWEYAGARWSTGGTGARTRRGDRDQHRDAGQPRGRAGLLPAGRRDQPVRLVGWRAVTVDAGESARVTVADRPPDVAALGHRRELLGQAARGGSLLVARGLGDIRATIGLPE